MATKDSVTHIEDSHSVDHHKPHTNAHIVPIEQEAVEDAKHINLSWRSWVVVSVCCFAYGPSPLSNAPLTSAQSHVPGIRCCSSWIRLVLYYS
jgi:hypothetical protein